MVTPSLRRRALCVFLAGWMGVVPGCASLAEEMCAEAQEIQVGMDPAQVRDIIRKHKWEDEYPGFNVRIYRYTMDPWVPPLLIILIVQIIPIFFLGLILDAISPWAKKTYIDIVYGPAGVIYVGPVRTHKGQRLCEHESHLGERPDGWWPGQRLEED